MKQIRKKQSEIALLKELADINQKLEELLSRKREIEKQVVKKKRKKKPASWNETTPMIKLVRPCQLEKFKAIITEWQEMSEVNIDIKNANWFDFKPGYKSRVVRVLKRSLAHNTKVFNISQRQLFLYLESHSNLGSSDSIKKAFQRCKL